MDAEKRICCWAIYEQFVLDGTGKIIAQADSLLFEDGKLVSGDPLVEEWGENIPLWPSLGEDIRYGPPPSLGDGEGR